MSRKKQTMTILSKADILGASDIQRERVSVPEWGGDVFVRGLTGAERDRFEGSIITQRGKNQSVNLTNIRAKLASMAICDEDGKALFNSADVLALSEKSAAALQRVFEVAQRLSGLKEEDVQELVGELKENPFDGSPTD
jgi:hypothetical protein